MERAAKISSVKTFPNWSHRIVAMLRALITENVDLTAELKEDLWSVEADRGQIEQVLMNLVVNALDAMPDGGKLRIYTNNEFAGPGDPRSARQSQGLSCRCKFS